MSFAAEPLKSPGPVRSVLLVWVIDLTLVMLFVAALYPALVFTRQTLVTDGIWSDLLTLTQPTYTYTGEELRKGHLPLWNPYWFAGFPHLAMPSAAVFYPTTVLFGFFTFEAAVKMVVLLHCFLSGVFSYALGRRVIQGRIPALYLAFASIGGDLVLPAVKSGSLWTLQTMAWFPLAVLFVHCILEDGGWGAVVALSVTFAVMVFGGDTQSLAFCLWFLAPYIVYLLIAQQRRTGDWRRPVFGGGMCLAAVLFGFGLAGIQLAPSRELFAESIRANGVSLTEMKFMKDAFSDSIKSFLWFKNEDFWRVRADDRLVIALAACGLIASHNAAARATAIAAAPCVLYAMMPEWFYKVIIHFPIYDGIRASYRILTIVWWAVAYLSAFGVAVWISKVNAQGRPRAIAAVVTLAALAAAVVLPYLVGGSMSRPRIVAGALAACGTILVLTRSNIRARWIAGLALVLAAAGIEALWRINALVVSGDPAPYAGDTDVQTLSKSRADIDRVALVYSYATFRHRAAATLLTRDRGLLGYHGLVLMRYARLFRDVGGVPIALMDQDGRLRDTGGFEEDWFQERLLPLLDLFNVRHIATIDFQSQSAVQLSRRGGPLTQVRYGRYGRVRDYVNSRALPPIFPIHDVAWCATDEEAIRLMQEGRINFHAQATLTGSREELRLRPASGGERATLKRFEPERIGATVELTAPAVVVFSEIQYPGWQASVDGETREVLCVDTALRGVQVDEGQHEIVLRYRPASLVRGAFVSVSTAALMVVVTLVIKLLHRRTRRVTAARV